MCLYLCPSSCSSFTSFPTKTIIQDCLGEVRASGSLTENWEGQSSPLPAAILCHPLNPPQLTGTAVTWSSSLTFSPCQWWCSYNKCKHTSSLTSISQLTLCICVRIQEAGPWWQTSFVLYSVGYQALTVPTKCFCITITKVSPLWVTSQRCICLVWAQATLSLLRLGAEVGWCHHVILSFLIESKFPPTSLNWV